MDSNEILSEMDQRNLMQKIMKMEVRAEKKVQETLVLLWIISSVINITLFIAVPESMLARVIASVVSLNTLYLLTSPLKYITMMKTRISRHRLILRIICMLLNPITILKSKTRFEKTIYKDELKRIRK